ncbi:MAG: hypothetical protein MI755_10800 [Sphingomonadales bacterium]|nr:hypothetical protein [Sphingomonadales bacterium]
MPKPQTPWILALIATLSITAVVRLGAAEAETGAAGFAIHSAGTNGTIAWRINTETGQVSACRTDVLAGAPVCSAWSHP